jgi:hypothetical protein
MLLLLLLPQARFWSEVYDGAKLFYLSGMQHGKYLKREVRGEGRGKGGGSSVCCIWGGLRSPGWLAGVLLMCVMKAGHLAVTEGGCCFSEQSVL